MAPEDLSYFQAFLADRSGLNLWPEKAYLLESRLARILRDRDLVNLSALAAKLRNGGDSSLERDVIEAMMTHETLFFRDAKSFELLRSVVLPELAAARRAERRLSIWCAACSTGQEPYSLGMMIDEMSDLFAGWSIRILATDLSTAIVDRARSGVFTQFEVQRGLPVRLLLKHFSQEPEGWTLDARIRSMVEFRPFNLLRDAAPFGRFDLILCRNVMIYFDASTRTGLFARLRRQIAPDGALMLGGAETVLGMTADFAPDRRTPGFYRPTPDVAPTMAENLAQMRLRLARA